MNEKDEYIQHLEDTKQKMEMLSENGTVPVSELYLLVKELRERRWNLKDQELLISMKSFEDKLLNNIFNVIEEQLALKVYKEYQQEEYLHMVELFYNKWDLSNRKTMSRNEYIDCFHDVYVIEKFFFDNYNIIMSNDNIELLIKIHKCIEIGFKESINGA